MSEPGDRIGDRYRGLAREAPPPALDAAILAASRRAVGARPGGARRWFAPVSVAAVLVLGIGVALRMQLEQPGVETSLPASEYALPQAAAPVEAPRAEPEAPAAATAPPPAPAAVPSRDAEAPPATSRRPSKQQPTVPPQPRAPARAMDNAASMPGPTMAAPAAPPAAAMERSAPPAVSERAPPPAAPERSFAPDPAPAAPPPAPAMRAAPPPAPRMTIQSAPREKRETAAGALAATPEAELERIARLRESGRHDEADRALAEFQRRFPDHRIAPATWERVRTR